MNFPLLFIYEDMRIEIVLAYKNTCGVWSLHATDQTLGCELAATVVFYQKNMVPPLMYVYIQRLPLALGSI